MSSIKIKAEEIIFTAIAYVEEQELLAMPVIPKSFVALREAVKEYQEALLDEEEAEAVIEKTRPFTPLKR